MRGGRSERGGEEGRRGKESELKEGDGGKDLYSDSHMDTPIPWTLVRWRWACWQRD